jgi:hypothetical protein
MASNYLYAQSETYRKKFPEWFAMSFTVATDLVKDGEGIEKIGERDFRIPIELTLGGDLRTYNPNFGDKGRGSASTGTVMTGSYVPLTLNYELPELAIHVTDDNPNALGKKAFKDAIKSAVPEMRFYLDKLWHRSSAVLAVGVTHSSGSGTSVYTCDTNHGVMLLRRGQPVTIYDTTLATNKGTARVLQINPTNRTVKLDIVVPSAANTDKICLAGVSGASPTALRGLPYWNDYSTSGSTAGVDRAVEPEIVCEALNASTSSLTHEMGMALYHRLLMRRGKAADNLVGLAAPAQQAVMFNNFISLQTYDLGSGMEKFQDRLPKGLRDKSFPFCGIPHFVDIHQDAKRIDWFVKNSFGKTEMKPLDFHQTPGDGQRFFQIYGGSGAPAAGVWFGVSWIGDYYNTNPGGNGVIYGLVLPTSGYYGT